LFKLDEQRVLIRLVHVQFIFVFIDVNASVPLLYNLFMTATQQRHRIFI